MHHKPLRGFTLVEIVITIGLVSVLFYVVFGTSNILQLQENGNFQTIARQLIVEEGEALRTASFSSLENRVGTPFIEVAYNKGEFLVQQSGNPYSPDNVLRASAAAGANNPSRLVVPTGKMADGGFHADFLVSASSPAGWKVGLYTHYHDDQNYYALLIQADQVSIVKRVESVDSTLWTYATSVPVDAWNDITFWSQNDTFNVTYGGRSFPTFISDTTLYDGYNVLGAFDGASVDFDDVSLAGTPTTWSFDGTGERYGQPPIGWRRAGPDLLPSGHTSVTITDAVQGFTDLKQAVLTVQWMERGQLRTLSSTININQQSVAP